MRRGVVSAFVLVTIPPMGWLFQFLSDKSMEPELSLRSERSIDIKNSVYGGYDVVYRATPPRVKHDACRGTGIGKGNDAKDVYQHGLRLK